MIKQFLNRANILLMLVGLLMSSLSTPLFLQILKFPFVAPEIFYVPLLIYTYRRLGLSSVDSVSFRHPIMWTLIFTFIAFINGEFDPIAISSTARCFFLLFCFFVIGRHISVDINFIRVLMFISFGSVLGWCMYNYLLYGSMDYLMSFDVLYGNMIAIPIVFSLALMYKRNYLLFGLVFLFNIYLCITTSLRRQIAVSALSAILSVIIANIEKLSFKQLIISVAMVGAVIAALPAVETFIENNDENMYKRVYLRTQDAIEGDVGVSDESRVNNSTKFIDEADQLLIPHGFVSFRTSKDGKGIFVDSPVYMLSYTFGVLPLIVYLFLYIKNLIACAKLTFIKKQKIYGFIFITASITLFLHFVEASMFSVSFIAPMTGIVIGLLFRKLPIEDIKEYV